MPGGMSLSQDSLVHAMHGSMYALPLLATSLVGRIPRVRRSFPVLDALHDLQEKVMEPLVKGLAGNRGGGAISRRGGLRAARAAAQFTPHAPWAVTTALNNTYASHCISLQHLRRRMQTLTPSSMLPACTLHQASTCLSSSSCASP